MARVRMRSVAPVIAGIVTTVAIFAGVAAGIPSDESPGMIQLALAAVASLLSGAIVYWQVKVQLEDRAGPSMALARSTASGSAPVLEVATRNLFQLPPDIGDFTGRAEDAAELAKLLTSPGTDTAVVLTTLSGKGGVGKTTLAVHVAHRVRDFFPDGQLYVNLRGAEAQVLDPAEVLARFLNELGIDSGSIPEQLDDRARLYRAQLSDRRVLTVLDNAATESQVRPLLPGNPGCAVLVTSRARMVALDGAHVLTLGVMTAAQGMDLLAAIVGRDRVGAEREAAAEIVRLCGRLPLALRIVGARLASRPTERLGTYAERLRNEQDRLDLLKAGDLEVRASFALSYEGCDPPLRRAFRLLGMLKAGDFASWPLASLMEIPVDRADELMERLVDVELLDIVGDDVTGMRRYRFHDLLRVFARERLAEVEPVGEQRAALERLLTEYVNLGINASLLLEPGGLVRPVPARTQPLARLRRNPRGWFLAERSAFVTSVALAADAELWDLTWRLAELLPVLFHWQSDWHDWEQTHRIALNAARRSGSREGEARIRCNLGLLHRTRGHYDAAVSELLASADIFTDIGDELWSAVARRQLGDTYRYTGQLHEGIACFTDSLAVFERHDSRRMAAGALNGLGDIYRGLSRWSESVDAFTRCIQIYESLNDRLEVARSKIRFGIVYRDRCLYADAEILYLDGLAVVRESRDRRWEARTLRHLGIVYRNTGRVTEAIEHFDRCLEMFDQLADRRAMAVTQRNKGDAHRYAGDFDLAEGCLNDALARFRELGDRRWEARTRIGLADTIRHSARFAEAEAHLDAALAIYRDIKDRPGEARVLRGRGILLRDQELWDSAVAAFDDSGRIFEELGDEIWVARAIAGRAAVQKARGRDWGGDRRRAEQICRDNGAREAGEAEGWLREW